jgi:hypothetical protein
VKAHPLRLLALATLVALLGASAATARTGAKPVVLKHGQGITVAGTDMTCGFAGPANHGGVSCQHSSSKAKVPFSFRIEENELLAYRIAKGRVTVAGAWKEPRGTIAEPRSAAVSRFKLVAKLAPGGKFDAVGSDLGCSVYAFKGKTVVACFKFDAKGIADGSYAAALSNSALQVSRFQNGNGTTVFVGSPTKTSGG